MLPLTRPPDSLGPGLVEIEDLGIVRGSTDTRNFRNNKANGFYQGDLSILIHVGALWVRGGQIPCETSYIRLTGESNRKLYFIYVSIPVLVFSGFTDVVFVLLVPRCKLHCYIAEVN
jgi:hypothetical protein